MSSSRALAKAPDDRYPSAAEFVAALSGRLAQRPNRRDDGRHRA